MSDDDPAMPSLDLLSTGVPGLDEVFGGGLPEYSFNLVAGIPGAGKTTLVHQITFANASAERPALYFTVLGEPPLKMLRYQKQMTFFDAQRVGDVIRFVDLSQEVLTGDLDRMLETIVEHVTAHDPGIVVVDSFRTVLRSRSGQENALQSFLQRLALHLASWQATTFLVGEYAENEVKENPVFTIADGIFWLTTVKDGNAVVRKLDVMKMRGRDTLSGLHTFRISGEGIHVFPRMPRRPPAGRRPARPSDRISIGVPRLDERMGGGPLRGDTTIVSGPSGTGKTALATHFLDEGLRRGDPGVLAIFEENVEDYLDRAEAMGFDLRPRVDEGMLRIIPLRSPDLSSDELLYEIREAVDEVEAQRLVIDSLNGFEVAIAPNFREDLRESIYRMVGALTTCGVSVLVTMEVRESFEALDFSPHDISFMAQNILFLRYVELDAGLERVLTVVKMRRSAHSRAICRYDITDDGLRLGEPLTGYQGLLTGVPTVTPGRERSEVPGLTADEQTVFHRLQAVVEATAAELQGATGLADRKLEAALARLVQLGYVVEVSAEGQVVYRRLSRPLRF